MIQNQVEFDEFGFRALGREETRIFWRDIIRVAYCMDINSFAFEVDDYWAFQTSDPNLITWVSINAFNDFIRASFSEEVHRRFGKVKIPTGDKWDRSQRKQSVKTYVIYPEADIGKSLYILKREKWWSLDAELHYALV
jgi:hypothetical protein